MCYPGSANSTEQLCRRSEAGAEQKGVQSYLYVFMLGNALHGVGATPIFTLGTAYIDENTKAERTSWYLGQFRLASLHQYRHRETDDDDDNDDKHKETIMRTMMR